MNPWGAVVILFGAVIAWVGIRGTQGTLFQDITGAPYQPNPNAPPWSQSQQGGKEPAMSAQPWAIGSKDTAAKAQPWGIGGLIHG